MNTIHKVTMSMYAGGGLLFLIPCFLHAQTANFSYITTFAIGFTNFIEATVPVLLAIALALFIWGLVVFIAHSGSDQEREEGRKKMLWGVIGLFVIVSTWGLVALLQNITGINGAGGNSVEAPEAPGT